jgi:hypothetical protein
VGRDAADIRGWQSGSWQSGRWQSGKDDKTQRAWTKSALFQYYSTLGRFYFTSVFNVLHTQCNIY